MSNCRTYGSDRASAPGSCTSYRLRSSGGSVDLTSVGSSTICGRCTSRSERSWGDMVLGHRATAEGFEDHRQGGRRDRVTPVLHRDGRLAVVPVDIHRHRRPRLAVGKRVAHGLVMACDTRAGSRTGRGASHAHAARSDDRACRRSTSTTPRAIASRSAGRNDRGNVPKRMRVKSSNVSIISFMRLAALRYARGACSLRGTLGAAQQKVVGSAIALSGLRRSCPRTPIIRSRKMTSSLGCFPHGVLLGDVGRGASDDGDGVAGMIADRLDRLTVEAPLHVLLNLEIDLLRDALSRSSMRFFIAARAAASCVKRASFGRPAGLTLQRQLLARPGIAQLRVLLEDDRARAHQRHAGSAVSLALRSVAGRAFSSAFAACAASSFMASGPRCRTFGPTRACRRGTDARDPGARGERDHNDSGMFQRRN